MVVSWQSGVRPVGPRSVITEGIGVFKAGHQQPFVMAVRGRLFGCRMQAQLDIPLDEKRILSEVKPWEPGPKASLAAALIARSAAQGAPTLPNLELEQQKDTLIALLVCRSTAPRCHCCGVAWEWAVGNQAHGRGAWYLNFL